MASHFSANQYENAFDSRRLQNWQLPKTYKERPDSYDGFTKIIANDRGHLQKGVPRSARSPWGEFVGTWDLPRTISGNITTYMARSDPAVGEIKTQWHDHQQYMENAKSPTKDLILTQKSPSKTKARTPTPTKTEDLTRPERPPPPSKMSISPQESPPAPEKEPMVE